ncbi:MAG: hypothetical protein AUJ57_06670 [Zetaproteobacteria bacterium CG1_02_53_45]|nr:MAG: hypothetical protein AUJ57_06670 [Zetaproteobacteria bacterium CG1_02_53_45]
MIFSPQSHPRALSLAQAQFILSQSYAEETRLFLACGDALLTAEKWNQCGIRVLFRTHFAAVSEGIHLSLRAPFFRSFFGGQRKDNGLMV